MEIPAQIESKQESTRLIDFTSVLASSVHDMKNGLCLLIQSIEKLSHRLQKKNIEEADELAQIHYEASRLNSNLLQMLALYRVEKDLLPLNIDEYYLDELMEELAARNLLYIRSRHIDVEFDLPEELAWYFDFDLVSNLLNDIFVNALRYCGSKIIVSAFESQGQLHIAIADDGDGYPNAMLATQDMEAAQIDLTVSRTGLGLYFARLIAETHEQNGNKGSILLRNGGQLNGSVFTLTLP